MLHLLLKMNLIAFLFAPIAHGGEPSALSERLEYMVNYHQKWSACDEKTLSSRRRVISKLNEHYNSQGSQKLSQELLRLSQGRYRHEPLGPLTLLVQKKVPRHLKDSFTFERDNNNWKGLESNLSWYHFWRQWSSISSQASSNLRDDYNRLIFNTDPTVSPLLIPIRKSTYDELLKCVNNNYCSKLSLPQDSVSFIMEYPELATPFTGYFSTEDPSQARKNIESLNEGFQKLFKRELPWKRDAVIPADKNTLLVNVDAGDLKGHETAIEKLLAGPWNAYGLRVKINWVNDDRSSRAIKLFVHLGSSDRAYTDGRGNIHLPPIVRLTTLPHEFGHVLGLPDEYYTYFFEKHCEYKVYGNSENIMSTSSRGRVLPSHIKTLRALYLSNF